MKEQKENLKRLKTNNKQILKTYSNRRCVNIGERVFILTNISGLLHRQYQTGVVVERNGGYVYVRPHWLSDDRIVECYDNELAAY